MQFHTMDNVLVEIYNIRNIESIKFYDFVVTEAPRLVVIPALLVIYDGGKELNLCSKDKYFTTFVKKVVQVYRDEKECILEDSLTDPFHMNEGIHIDAHSEEILTSSVLGSIPPLYQFYDGKDSYDGSLIFQKDEVDLLFPIVKYHIIQMFSNTDKTIHFDEELNGYRNYYMINGNIDGVPMSFPFMYNKNDDHQYEFTMGNLLGNNSSVRVIIQFMKDRIMVQASLGSYEIIGNFTYLMSNGVVKAITDIEKSGITIHYQNLDLETCENDLLNLANFDRESSFHWFQLPWDAYYGIDSKITDMSDSEKIVEIANMYLYGHGQSFMRKEYLSRNYHRQTTANVLGENISLEEAMKDTIGVCLSKKEGLYLIETAFLDTLQKQGYYDEKLKNRYFYHVVKNKKGLKSIHGKSMTAVCKFDGILDNGDTLNPTLMLKMVRGK